MIKRTVTIYITAAMMAINAFAGDNGKDKIQESMYSAMNNSNIGMEFYLTFHPAELTGNSNYFKIYVASDYETEVTLTMPWSGKILKKTTKKRDIIEFALSADEALCYNKKPNEKPLAKEIFNRKALHLKADAPVTVYAVAELSEQSGGYLALPVPVLGDEYVISSSVNSSVPGKLWVPGFSSIVVSYDSTDIEITPSVATYNITAGETKKYTTLMAGDIVLIASMYPGDDLTGTTVKATKPVGVISGNYCTFNGVQAVCDYTIEMESPLYAWGMVYPVFPVPGNSGYLLKILSSENGKTKVFRNGELIGQLPSKGGSDNIGYLIHEAANEPVVISSDKRINVVQYNIDKNKEVIPFQMNVVPFSQYPAEIYFSTPGVPGNNFYDKYYINIVYKGNTDGSLPDDAVIYIPEQGSLEWKAVKLSELSPGPGSKFNLEIGNGDTYFTKTIELKNGSYRMASASPFSVYTFGNSLNASSYGFPASVTLFDTKNDFTNPVPTWTMNCDGGITNGLVTDMPENPDERSNMQAIVLVADNSNNYKMSYSGFIPGATRTVKWGLDVIDKTKDARAMIKFIDRHGNDTIITIDYYAPNLTITPGEIDFEEVKAGRIVTKEVIVKNNSATSTYNLTKANVNTDLFGFRIDESSVPVEIKPGKSAVIKVKFSSADEGDFTDSLGLGDDCVFANRVKLTARAFKPVISVSDLDFGEVITGNESIKNFVIYNKGKVDLVITDTSGNESKIFKPMFNREFSPNPGLTIKPGDSLELNISFRPTAESFYEDKIIFSSDAERTDSIVVLKGIGIIPGLKIAALDFGRRRIDRLKFPDDGPYEAILKFENESSKTIDVLNIEKVILSGAETAFITDEIDNNKAFRLNPGNTVERKILFHPETTGDYKMKLIVTYTGGNKKETIISGIGAVPRLKAEIEGQAGNLIDFGEVLVNRPNSVARNIKLINEDWQYSDTLRISDIKDPSDNNLVGTANRKFGTEGFYFEKSLLNLPRLLQPGESLTFRAEYISPKVSSSAATLKIESDAENELLLELKGRGLESKLIIESNNPKICLGETDTIFLSITNSGNLPSTINSVEFTKNTQDFSFLNAFEPFSLEPMASRVISIIFNPGSQGISKADININSVTVDKVKDYIHTLGAESYKYYLNSEIYQENDVISVGESIVKAIKLTGVENIAEEKLNRLDIVVRYDGNFLKILEEYIQIGKTLDGKFEISSVEILDSPGVVKFAVIPSSENKYISESGDIAEITFKSYYPSGQDEDVVSRIEHDIYLKSDCIEMKQPQNGTIKVGIVCSENLIMINYTGGSNSLDTSTPNPADTKAYIQFSIALNAYTVLKIYNSMGQLVDVPLSDTLKSGIYKFELDLDKYQSGVYWYTLESGPYTATNKMVISR